MHETVQSCIDSMPRRIKALIAAKDFSRRTCIFYPGGMPYPSKMSQTGKQDEKLIPAISGPGRKGDINPGHISRTPGSE
ncbi:hypothetical protein JTE90_016535 [Oedothorax gibbosus]|uniref:Uncharacterized protein n=1 Tax=Oedothorax gibbosus TaxID=931172 RepID=A0AAV6UVF2_9ARAC|nr:hypothetical protein JTE90_016535 [Oedothorax gibbosus]